MSMLTRYAKALYSNLQSFLLKVTETLKGSFIGNYTVPRTLRRVPTIVVVRAELQRVQRNKQ
jgi:hypothetical protein